MICPARPRLKYNQMAHAIWLSLVLGTPALAQAPGQTPDPSGSTVSAPSQQDAERVVQQLTPTQVQRLSEQLNDQSQPQSVAEPEVPAPGGESAPTPQGSEVAPADEAVSPTDGESSSPPSENPEALESTENSSSSSASDEILIDEIFIDGDVPWIWTDLCIEQIDQCYTGVASRRRDGKWEVDLSEENLRAYNIDSSSLTIKREGSENWVVLDETTYDAAMLKITWSLPLSSLEGQVLNRDEGQYTNVDRGRHPFSAALDYSLAYGQKASGSGRLTIGKGHTALMTSGSMTQGDEFVQGLTWLEHDQPEKNLRWSAGDIVAHSFDPLGAGLLIEGVSVRKVFETTPTKIFTARPSMTGIVDQAGTLEVYSNGVLISSQEVRPGPYTLQQLGVGAGRQNIRVVLRDVAGNRRVLTQTSYYGGSGLLGKGISDYGMSAGQIKPSAILEGPVLPAERVVQAYYRRGFNERITAGARVDWGQNVQSYGVSTVFASPLGQFDLFAASSSAGGRAYAASYLFSSTLFSLGLRHQRQDENYLLPGDLNYFMVGDDDLERVLETSQVSISASVVPRVSVSLAGTRERYDTGAVEKSAGAMVGGQIFKNIRWELSFQQRQRSGEPKQNVAGLTLSVPLGRMQNASFSAQQGGDGGVGYAASWTKSREGEFGFSYAGNAQQRAMGVRGVTLRGDYQGRYGLYGVQLDQLGPDRSVFATISGGVVFAEKNLFFTAPLSGSYAVLRAPNAPGVPIMRENQPVGNTNSKGMALIRNLGAYYPSQIGFDPEALPIDMSPGDVISKRIVPTAHTATVIEFNAAPVFALQAQLMWPDGTPVNYGAIMFSDPINQTVSIGGKGMLWLEGVEAGTYIGDLSTDVGTGRCTLNIEEQSTAIQDVGEVVCERLTTRSSPKSSKEQSTEPQDSPTEQPQGTEVEDPQAHNQGAQQAQGAGQEHPGQEIMPAPPTPEKSDD